MDDMHVSVQALDSVQRRGTVGATLPYESPEITEVGASDTATEGTCRQKSW